MGGVGAPRDRGGGASGGGGVTEERGGGETMSGGGSPGGGGQDCGGDAAGGGGGRESGGAGVRVLGGMDPGSAAVTGCGGGDDARGCQVGQSRSLLPLQDSETGVRAAEVSNFFLFCFIFLTHCSMQRTRLVMPGVQECKNKVCDDEGGVTERSGGDREEVGEMEGGGGRR